MYLNIKTNAQWSTYAWKPFFAITSDITVTFRQLMHILPLISYLLVDVRSKSTGDATRRPKRELDLDLQIERERERGGEIEI